MNIIKCHIYKLDKNTCQQKCVEVDDVKTLYKDGMTEKDAFPDRFCTAHKCPHNHTGFQCSIDACAFGFDK